MAQTWLSRMKAHENSMERRMASELQTLAGLAGSVYAQYARSRDDAGQVIIQDTAANRQAVKDAMWNRVVAPYFGTQSNQLQGQAALNPFMRLIKDGVEGAVRIQAERHVSIIEKNAPPDVVRFLTGPRSPQFVGEITPSPLTPLPQAGEGRQATPEIVAEQGGSGKRWPWYDPWHLFVDENGYTLSDKGWRTSQEARQAIDSLLDMHIPLGTAAVDVAVELERYLYPEALRVRTRTPYGYDGSYWARRLARTEITAAAGRSTVNASLLNPFVEMMFWRLSLSHPCCDVCDEYAAASPYMIADLPGYPAHPHELCTIGPIVVENRMGVVRQLQEMMLASYDEPIVIGSGFYTRRQLQGAFNLDWLVQALLSGVIISIVRKLYAEAT